MSNSLSDLFATNPSAPEVGEYGVSLNHIRGHNIYQVRENDMEKSRP
jgi:hypothetical protein